MSILVTKTIWNMPFRRARLARLTDAGLAGCALAFRAGLPARSGLHAGYTTETGTPDMGPIYFPATPTQGMLSGWS